MDNGQKTVDFKARNNETSIIFDSENLMIKGYCRRVKLTRQKVGVSALKSGGPWPSPSPFRLCYGMEWPFGTTKAAKLGMVILLHVPYCWGTECELINSKFAKVPD